MRDLPDVVEPGRGEQRDDAVAMVVGHDVVVRRPGPSEAGQVPEDVGEAAAVAMAMRGVVGAPDIGRGAAEVDDGDRSSRSKGTQRVARERAPTVVIEVVQGQRRDHMVEGGVLGGDPVGVSPNEGEIDAAAARLAGGPAQGVRIGVEAGHPRGGLGREHGERQVPVPQPTSTTA